MFQIIHLTNCLGRWLVSFDFHVKTNVFYTGECVNTLPIKKKESSCLEGTLVFSSPASLPAWNCFRSSCLLRTMSSEVLNISRDGDFTTSLGNLFQCLTTLTIKKFVLCLSTIFNVNILYYYIYLLLYVFLVLLFYYTYYYNYAPLNHFGKQKWWDVILAVSVVRFSAWWKHKIYTDTIAY